MDLPIYEALISDDINDDTEINFVALVKRPAIERNFMAFAEKMRFAVQEDRRIVSGPLLLADTPIYRNMPGMGEFYIVFTAEQIYKAVNRFFKKGYQANLNTNHSDQIVPGATMFESWIADSTRGVLPMKGFEDAPDGSWFGSFKVEDDATWNAVKSGEFKGFSIEGFLSARRVSMSSDKDTKLFAQIQQILSEII